MSTWTSRGAVVAVALAVAGCAGGVAVTRKAPEAIRVAQDSVVVAGPPGYCVDRAASREGDQGAFVLLGSCASLAGNATFPHPSQPGVLTVTVSEGAVQSDDIAPLLSGLEAFFLTEEGRAALSRNGGTRGVEIVDTEIRDGVLYLHARDEGGKTHGMAADYWRALFGVNHRLVTLSVNAFSASPFTTQAGLTTLDAFARRIRAANAAGVPS